ncbi:TIGR03621 family F420-dependent LLM class oxidoreductase [Nocardia sp. NPDC055029]
MNNFRFGVQMAVPGIRAEWVSKCRKAEDLGYDVISVPDHLGMPAPFPALVLAGEATERVRLATFVINTPFYNPAQLARDAASTDQFVDGRLELGLGAGYIKAEFDAAGVPFPGGGERIDHLERTIVELRQLYAKTDYQPQPVQPGGPPILVAGWGRRALTLAAQHADVISFTGMSVSRDGMFEGLADVKALVERVELIRALPGERASKMEFNITAPAVAITNDRRSTLEQFQPFAPLLTIDQLGELPHLLVGTAPQIADQLRVNRELFGLNYISVLEQHLEALAPVIELLR